MPRQSDPSRSMLLKPSISVRLFTRVRRVMLGLIVSSLGLVSYSYAAPVEPRSDKVLTFDYLILALSWSPTYCASSAKRGETAQCQNPANRGFVLQGLWPQAADGARLRCPAGKAAFSKALFERALEVFPDLGLAQSQWQRHGQCFGLVPDAYIEKAATARGKLIIPEQYKAIGQPLSLSPDDIRKGFVSVNSGLGPDSVSVSCRNSELVEVLVCMKSDLSGFVSCPQVTKRSCRASVIQIPASQSR